ncbi:unannotated protein [freshwater metagenome]|uniref:Unannotated protein n=1 Tax=freshwater metagenome TaxID=449393 RepID=A0A6J6YD37_9ZZZZ
MHVAHAGGFGSHGGAGAEQGWHLGPIDQAHAGSAAQGAAARQAHLGKFPVGGATVGGAAHGDVADRLVADLFVEHVFAHQQLAGLGLERVKIDVPTAQTRAFAIDGAEPRSVDKNATALTGCYVSDHAWSGAGARRNNHDVFDTTDCRPARVEQRQPHHPKRIYEIASHAGRLPRGPACEVTRYWLCSAESWRATSP